MGRKGSDLRGREREARRKEKSGGFCPSREATREQGGLTINHLILSQYVAFNVAYLDAGEFDETRRIGEEGRRGSLDSVGIVRLFSVLVVAKRRKPDKLKPAKVQIHPKWVFER